MKFDFDHVPERRGTDSVKWNESIAPDVLPMWVADMDFRVAPCIQEALRRRVEHGVFGYTLPPAAYYEAVDRWHRERHGYRVERDSVIVTPGIVPALSAIVRALAQPGEGVMIFTPVYNCYFSSIRNNGCRVVDVPLVRRELPHGEGDGKPHEFTYEMDREAIERRLPEARCLLLCSPHNPGGRVWTRDELEWLAEACRRHNVTVVSDEIHCELTMPGEHFIPWATVSYDAIICTAPSKAFNTAGLHASNIIVRDAALRARVDRAVNINEVCDIGPFGVTGLIAAYNEGAPWLDALRGYLADNYRMLRLFFSQELPECALARLEATYLAWVDVSMFPIPVGKTAAEYLTEHGVMLCGGEMYGDPRFMRINFACPRSMMMDGLCRMAAALRLLMKNE